MLDDIVPLVLEVLIKAKKAFKVEDIIDASGCERAEVVKALSLLNDLNLVNKEKNEKTNVVTYKLIKEIKAIHLAKAAQLGLDLNSFESFFKIDKKEKELALNLATQAEKIKQLELNKRKPLLQKRNYFLTEKTDDVYETLHLLLEATNSTIYEYIEELAKKDPHLKLLISMHEEAENSVRDYASTLK